MKTALLQQLIQNLRKVTHGSASLRNVLTTTHHNPIPTAPSLRALHLREQTNERRHPGYPTSIYKHRIRGLCPEPTGAT